MAQLSQAQLLACGLTDQTAAVYLPQINHWLATLSASDCWKRLTQQLLQPDDPFALHDLLYTTTFSDWDVSQGTPPAWFPEPAQIQQTNLAALMRSLQINSYPDLHAWSVQHRCEFWDRMIQRLGIKFQQKYSAIADLTQGAEHPQWLIDAQFNIVESCFQAADTDIAILFQAEGGTLSKLTYGELHAMTNRVANGLSEIGIQSGDAIAITMPMTAAAVAIYLGIIKAGGVVVSIADSFSVHEIATRLRIANARAIFTQAEVLRAGKHLPLYTKVIEAQAPMAIVLQAESMPLRTGDRTWESFLSANDQFDAVPRSPADYINILFSSGTTGEPKAIPWTQTTPIKCAVDAHLHHDIHPGDVLAWYTNLGWMMGPWLIYASLMNRAAIALYDGTPTQREFGQFIEAARVTMLGVVPSLVNTWKTSHCMQGLDWSSIKAFSSTGECSNPQDMLFLMSLARYKPIIEYCGGTEIGGAYLTGTVIQPCAPSTFTTPALGLDVMILADGQPASVGEAFIVPPSIGLSTELLNADHHRVYFASTPSFGSASIPLRRHGDQIERLANGYYRAQGRVDDTMNLCGIKVSSTEIERALNMVESVAETAAIALPTLGGGPNRLVIYVVLQSERSDSETAINTDSLKAELQRAIAQQLNPLFKIHDIVIVATLPRTASNKVMRRILRDRYHHDHHNHDANSRDSYTHYVSI
jgi:acetyl-CoA synthetase